jgi:hypothetical protein
MSNVRPYLINDDMAAGKPLVRISERDPDFAEDWLQRLLFQHPSILPVENLDEAYCPLVSLGREIAQIDDLYISPNGLITIVETKLWRNAEAHRTVVAQILDYVNTLTTWSYDQLDRAVASYHMGLKGQSTNIHKLVKAAVRSFDIGEIDFQNKVQECLNNGRFALLIVGDKIYPEVTQLANLIQSAPHLKYSMGFVELRCYRVEKDSNWPLIVIPHFVAKTKEYIRAVVTVVYEEKKPEVQVTHIAPEEYKQPSKVDLNVFIESIPSDLRDFFRNYLGKWIADGYSIHWGKVGFSMGIPWKGKRAYLFDAFPTNARIIPEKVVGQYGLPEHVYKEYRSELLKSNALGGLMVSGRQYQNYDKLAKDDIALLLDATDKFFITLSEIVRAGGG